LTHPLVLLLEPLHPEARAALAVAATVVELTSPDAALEAVPLGRVEALVTRGRGRVDAALLARLGSLRVIARAGVGLDNVDLEAARARGIPVLNVPNALTVTVAEHAVALALAARRDIPRIAQAARSGDWDARERYAGASIAGARVAVLGLGAIGQRTAKLFGALGADVVTWNRTTRAGTGEGGTGEGDAGEGGAGNGISYEPDLESALDGADVVSLHMALTPETRGFLGAARLSRLATGAAVINTARPGLVDRQALLSALESGQVARYAVDGFEPEPPPREDPLLSHPGVIVTPHVAALTREAFANLCLATVEGVLSVLAGGEPTRGAQIVP
jgi:phosphoglycerate dehydrogenase-like enzyme